MKEHNDHNLSSVSSFSDFVIERKRLLLKKRLIEARLQFNAGELKEIDSLGRDLPFDLIRDITQKFSDILERLFKSDGKTGTSDTSSGT